MTKLQWLHAEFGRSPWFDNLRRPYMQDGTLDDVSLTLDGQRIDIFNRSFAHVLSALEGKAERLARR